jgi:glycosyltransferase involved in cell wall biosynthesis
VLPYHRASQSGIAQLAFAFGVPVVATRVGGLPEVIEDHSTGLLVNAGDEQGMADAMLRLLTDPSLCRALSARAREEAATRYSWSHVAKLTQEVYDAAKEAIGT